MEVLPILLPSVSTYGQVRFFEGSKGVLQFVEMVRNRLRVLHQCRKNIKILCYRQPEIEPL
jgi:hypothetical protein